MGQAVHGAAEGLVRLSLPVEPHELHAKASPFPYDVTPPVRVRESGGSISMSSVRVIDEKK